MRNLTHTDQGHGPVVVLVHGVGAGPRTMDALAGALVGGHRVLVVERPTGPGGSALDLQSQADALVAHLHAVDATGGVLVGVSGGATLGLVIGMRHPTVAAGLVLHEPLVGHHAPALHQHFAEAAAKAGASERAAVEVVRAVMGERSWRALDPAEQDRIVVAGRRWQQEIPVFATFDPTLDDLRGLGATPLLTTRGDRSGPARDQAAAVLATLAGAERALVPGAGNAVQVDAPEAFAELVRAFAGTVAGAAA